MLQTKARFLQVGASGIIAGCSLAVSILLTRNLQLSDRGVIGAIFVIGLGALQVAHLGIPMSLTLQARHVLEHRSLFQALGLTTYRNLFLAAAFMAATIQWVGASQLTMFSAVSYAVFTMLTAWNISIIQGFDSMVRQAEYRALPAVLALVGTICAILFLQHSIDYFVAASSVAAATSWALSASRVRQLRSVVRETDTCSCDLGRELRQTGRHGFIAHIGIHDLFRTEGIAAVILLTSAEAGFFFAVAGLAGWVRVLFDGLSTHQFNHFAADKVRIEEKLLVAWRSIYLGAAVVILTLVIGGLVGNQTLALLLGPEFSDSYPLFAVTSLSLTIAGVKRLYLDVLRSGEAPGKASAIEALGLMGLPAYALHSHIANFDSIVSFALLSLAVQLLGILPALTMRTARIKR